MQLDQIQAYRAVQTTGTTLSAARKLGISQSAVSRRLSQLEDSLGISLFLRDKGKLIPTRESSILQPYLTLLFDQEKRVHQIARDIKSGNSDVVRLRLAVPSSLTLSIMPTIIADFLRLNDKVQIELLSGPYDSIERMLLDDRAEIGFIRVPTATSGLQFRPLMQVPTVCVLPLGHPLAEIKQISFADLIGVPIILLGRRSLSRSVLDAAFLDHGVRPDVRVEAHSVCSACGLVASGIGVTLVNELMARDYENMPVVVKPLSQTIIHRYAFSTNAQVPPTQTAIDFMEFSAVRLEGLLNS